MRKCLFISMLLFFSIHAFSQTQISGQVLDGAANEPMIGASVQVPGTSVGSVTDLDGKFSFTLPEGKFIVQVSMIGYKTQVINVKGKSSITVTLYEDSKVMDEVVVVGYGTMKKRDLSGAVSQIKSDDIMLGGATDVSHAVQGKIAGVQVNQNDGAPGAGVSITVRGANSFTTSSQPLYIVDGIPFETGSTPASGANDNSTQNSNPLSIINPHDIESIEVLKDASATAIYGSRGANGVVIITTKKGQTGKPKIEFNASWSVSKIGKRVKMLDPVTYANYINEGFTNSQKYEGATGDLPYRGYVDNSGHYVGKPEDYAKSTVTYEGKEYTISTADWQDEIYRTGWQQDYSLSVSGGTENGYYNMSGSYTKQDGIIKHTGYERYGLSLNISRHITKWLEVGSSSHFTQQATDFQRTNSSENTGIIRSALLFPPTYGPSMDLTQVDELMWLAANPVTYINGARDRLKGLSFFSSNYVEAKIMPWLKFRQNLGFGYNDNHRSTFYDKHTYEGRNPINGKAGRASNIWKSLTAESILTFDKKFGIHAINAVVGLTFEKGIWDNESLVTTNFPYFSNISTDIGFATNKANVSSDEGKQTLESFLARVNYTLLDKYLFTVSMRTDGSSKFVTGNKWATFPSAAFAWRAGDETFIQDLNVFSNLKFRLSYGETGNQAIGSYRTLTILAPADYAFRGGLESGIAPIDWRGPSNPNLKWETTGQFNAGIDMGFLDNRLQFTVDYYYKKTRNLLQNVSLPYSSGWGNMLINSGNVTNEGLEFSLNYDVLKNSPVKWTVNANLSMNRNKLGGLDGDQYATALWSKADQVFLQRNGCPMGTLYGYVEDGFYNTIAEVRSMKEYAGLSDAEAKRMIGEIKYRDLNGDGQITAEDRTIIGDTNPKFTYGITNNLNYKDFSLSFMLQGSYGNDIFNANLMDIQLANEGNITTDAYAGRWTEATAATATWPKAIAGYTRSWLISNRYVEKGSYMKMKYITLSYNWNKPIPYIERVKISLTANNLFTITNYSWFDPDVNAFGADASRRGVDSYSYPSARTYMLGLNVTF